MDLVPDRECGDCDVCCVWLPIMEPGIAKLGGTPCRNLVTGKGCAVYEDRPNMCQGYHCVWRSVAALDDAWRPDRSGILIEFDKNNIPPGYQGPALKFTILGDIKKLEWMPFLNYVAAMAEQGVPMFLMVPVHHEYMPEKVFLNDGVKRAVMARDLTALVLELSRAALVCTTAPGQRIDLAEATAEVRRERGGF